MNYTSQAKKIASKPDKIYTWPSFAKASDFARSSRLRPTKSEEEDGKKHAIPSFSGRMKSSAKEPG
jgi:hypothetical protein